MADDVRGMQILDETLVSGLGGPGDEAGGFSDIWAVSGIFFAGDFDFLDIPVGRRCTGSG